MPTNNNINKDKIKNAIKLILGVVLIFLIAKLFLKPPSNPTDLTSLTITANNKMATHPGRYAKYGYSITADELKAKFTIDNCVNFVCDRNKLEEINAGDILKIKIDAYFSNSLLDSDAEVPIYALDLNNEKIFSSEDFLNGQKKQNIRRLIFVSIGGLFILLSSVTIKRKRIIWAVFILLTIATFVLMEMKIV